MSGTFVASWSAGEVPMKGKTGAATIPFPPAWRKSPLYGTMWNGGNGGDIGNTGSGTDPLILCPTWVVVIGNGGNGGDIGNTGNGTDPLILAPTWFVSIGVEARRSGKFCSPKGL